MSHAIENQAALVLHLHPYRESQFLVDLFSQDEGRLRVIARTNKKNRAQFRAEVQPFRQLTVSWRGKSDLPYLTHWQAQQAISLQGESQWSAFYLNELLLRLLAPHDPHPQLFNFYLAALNDLQQHKQIEATLRIFEINLLDNLGYAVPFEHDVYNAKIEDDAQYTYITGQGFDKFSNHSQASFNTQGRLLKAIAAKNFSDPAVLKAAKQMLRHILRQYLGDKPLASREFFMRSSQRFKQ